jgi:asparagine synthase (glutamine-hydrolysing)
MFRGVNQLLPAEEVVIERGRVSNRRYWKLQFEEPVRTRPIREYAEELLALLKKSVKRQLMSDVPVGAYLSGGIDSSIIVALMNNLNNSSLETFSIIYNDPRYDESHAIQVAARSLGVVNHTIVAEPSLAESYPNILYHLEIPFRHPVSIPYYHLSRFVREQGIKVVLTGEGSDELFGAYNVFVADKVRRIIAEVPSMYLRKLGYKIACRLRGQSDSLEYLLKVHFESPELLVRRYGTVPPWYYHWRMLDSLRQDIYSSSMREELAGVDVEEELVKMDKSPMNGSHPHNASIWLETQTRLPNWILVIGDRCSMAHGVEARVPYLDHELVEYVARLPFDLKLHGFTTKFILREAAKGLIKKEILHRRKFPFSAPIGSWFFNDRPPAFVNEMLCEDSIHQIGIFDPQEVTKARALLASSVPGTFERLRLEYLVFGILGVQSLSVVMKSF